MRKKRKFGCAVYIILVALLLAAAFAMPIVGEYMNTTSVEGDEVVIQIPEGASSSDIGDILKENGLVKNTFVFRLKAKSSPNGSKMNYGTFTLHEGMCIDDIIDTLASSFAYEKTVRFTVPEGYSVEWIATAAQNLGFCTKEEFLAALNDEYDYEFLKYIPNVEGAKYKLQGYLYPDTYEFFEDATAHDIIDKMLSQFEKKISGEKKLVGDNMHETIILASILEREALLESEMPKIAGVINNRIEKGMKLQVDATVQYVVSNGEYNVNRITYSDLKINSPYNTYVVSGLPVGPIANPSIKAIEAALSPEKHDYLYYHTDTKKNDGSHIFTKTYEEHLASQ